MFNIDARYILCRSDLFKKLKNISFPQNYFHSHEQQTLHFYMQHGECVWNMLNEREGWSVGRSTAKCVQAAGCNDCVSSSLFFRVKHERVILVSYRPEVISCSSQ